MKKVLLAALLLPGLGLSAAEYKVAGPDGRLVLTVGDNETDGSIYYSISYDNDVVVDKSPLGFIANTGDYSKNLRPAGESVTDEKVAYSNPHIKTSKVEADYKRLITEWEGNDKIKLGVEFMVGNNDVAFRYLVPRKGETGAIRIFSEETGYRMPENTVTFLTPQSDAMIAWKRTKPSYEERYKVDEPMDTKSKYGHGYTFPCLFKTESGKWALLSETGVDSRYCASRLSDYNNGVYKIEFPMPEENNGNGTSEPAFALPGATPWRTVTVGDNLAPITETTVIWDVVEPKYKGSKDYTGGRGTWSWILWQDDSINLEDQKKFVDLAAAMGYEYTLIDNWWDNNIGKEGMKELADYAASKGVGLIIWYSSSGYWNDIEQSPINKMDNPISRKEEMKWLRDIGAKGVKVDFFGGDKQETMRLYEQILSDADDYGLMVIFHGCTLPRGWERMYPNYVGSEAVLASENLIFTQKSCDEEAFSATLHPFIRNTVGCMEFGGVLLNKRMHKSNNKGNYRKTSDVFEIATGILFQNPVQNFALAPNNLEDAPQLCLDFMKDIPTMWDETRYVDGYPGKYAVIARRTGDKWYVAGVSALEKPITLDLDLDFLGTKKATLIYDDKKGPAEKSVNLKNGKLKLTLNPSGGIILKN